MNRMKTAACVVLLIAASLPTPARQNSADKRSSTDQQAKPATEQSKPLDPSRQKILSVLDTLLETQKSFTDNNLRIAIRVQIADMLWGYDEPRARLLFEDALAALAAANLTELAASSSSSHPRSGFTSVALSSIRTVIRRDPALAAKLGDSPIDPPLTSGQRPVGPNGDLRYLLAVFLSPEDPQRAARLAKPFADRGEVTKLIIFIRGLRTKDAKAADGLFFQLFEKTRLGEPSIDDIRWLASYVFPDFGNGVISFSSGGGERETHKSISLNSAMVEQFLDVAYNTIPLRLEESLARAETDRSFFRFPRDYAIAKLLGAQFDLFMPDRAEAFRSRVEEVRRRVPPDQQQMMAVNEPGTVSDLLARAAVLTDPREKDSLYQKAAEQAIFSGDIAQASVIVEKIVSESVRSSQRQRISDSSSDEIRKALQAGDFDKAEKMISLMSDRAFSRMWMFRSLIGGLYRKDRPRAIQLLDEAYRVAANIENRYEIAWQLMMLAGVCATVDANRGFEEMAKAIEEFNRAGFAPEWEKYQESEIRDNSGRQNPIARVNVGLSSLLDNSDFQSLGLLDFDRALGVARQMQPREASALVQLAACRGALSKLQPVTPPKPISPAKQQEAGKAKQP